MKKTFLLILCVFLMLPACANIQNDRTRTTTEGALVGAGAGAGVGAIIGHLAGSAKVGALVGGLLGGAIGAGVGDHIADKKEQYATREKWLDACIASASKKNEQLAAYSQRLRAESQQLDRTSRVLAQRVKQQQISKTQLNTALASYKKKKQEVDAYIISGEQEVAKQTAVLDDARKNKNMREAKIIEHEIAQLKYKLEQLRNESNKIANMSMRISV